MCLSGPNEEIQEGGMNPRDRGIDKRRPKSFHTSRHRIRFKDEEEEDDDDDEEDTSPDETSKLREDFDDNDEVMNQGEIINPEEDEDFPHQNPRSESIKSR